MLHIIIAFLEVKYFLLFIAFRVLYMWPGAAGFLDLGKVRNIMSDKQMEVENCLLLPLFF